MDFYGNTHISAERFHGICLSTPKATFCVIALCYIPEVDTGRILPIFWQGILKRDFSEIQMFGFIRCIFSSLNLVWKHRAMKHACEYNHALLQLLGIQSVHWSYLIDRNVLLWYLDFSQRSHTAHSPTHLITIRLRCSDAKPWRDSQQTLGQTL